MKAPISRKAEKILDENPEGLISAIIKDKRKLTVKTDVIRFSDFCLKPNQIKNLRFLAKEYLKQNIEELSDKMVEEILAEVNREI